MPDVTTALDMENLALELTILMPCLNEAETIERCVTKAQKSLADLGIQGEVLVADNGSTDGSQALAQALGARVVAVPRKGYGAAVDGAMTRYVRVPARILHAVPDSLPIEQAALSEPCCVAYNATAVNSRILPGDRILVLGPGPIGVLCAAIARLCGAQVALAGLDRDRIRLDRARAYGCEILVGDPLPWCRTGDGLGVDGVIDATGVSASLATALEAVRPAGWITKVGWGPQPVGFSLDPLVQKNVRLQGSFSHNWPVWERIVALLASGQLDVRPVIGGEWPLARWHDAFETMHRGDIIKSVLRPSA